MLLMTHKMRFCNVIAQERGDAMRVVRSPDSGTNRGVSDQARDAIQSMIAALEMEIHATDQALGRQRGVALSFGTRESENPNPVYQFHPAYPMPDSTDEVWALIAKNGRRVPGKLVQWDAETVLWEAQGDFGAEITDARLVPDQTQLLRGLKDRLNTMLETADQEGGAVNWSLIQETLNLKPPEARDHKHPVPKLPALNERQRLAVKSALANSLTLLWGPPGTGKTTTLAYLLTTLAEAGQTVLLISNTNVAVDAALAKVVERWRGHPALEQGVAQRLGHNYTEAIKAPEIAAYVVPEEIVLRRSAHIQEKLHRVWQQRDEAARDVRIWESVEALDGDVRIQSANAAAKANRISVLQQHANHLQGQWQKVQKALQRGPQRSRPTSIGQKRRQRQREIYERIFTQWRTLTADIERMTVEEREHRTAQARAIDRLKELQSQYGINPKHIGEASRFAESARSAVRRLKEQEALLESQIDAMAREVRRARRVTATTLTQAFREKPETMRADVVIVDEASMAVLPTIVYAAGLARQAVVYIGDFRQLPAVVLSDHELARTWLRKDVFSLHSVPEALAQGRKLPYLVALNEQHRMDEAICEAANALFYPDSPLITKVRRDEPPSRAFPTGALLYVDTGPWGSFTLRGPKGTSKTNPLHTAAAVALVRTLLERGDAGIGVTTPYRPQVAAIQAAMEEANIADQVMVDTIHRYQGSERPMMILDVSDAPGTSPSQFMQADSLDADGARLLNVALTRAQKQVIVLADMAYLLESRGIPERALSRRMVDYLKRNGKELDLGEVMPLYGGDAIWKEMTEDIQAANKAVYLSVPDLSEDRVDQMIRWSAIAGKNHTPMTVTTRPPQQQRVGSQVAARWLDSLRKEGIAVKTESQLVRRTLDIDNRLTWFYTEASREKLSWVSGFRV